MCDKYHALSAIPANMPSKHEVYLTKIGHLESTAQLSFDVVHDRHRVGNDQKIIHIRADNTRVAISISIDEDAAVDDEWFETT